MTALLAADPGAVRRAAGALDATAAEADGLVRQVERQQPPCWRGPSSRDYSAQLHVLCGRIGAIARSHDSAAEALVGYARDLAEAQERAEYAERLGAEGRRRSREWAARQVVGPDPGTALVAAAQRTLDDAESLHRAAAARAAARLRELAAAAPEQDWTSKTLRPLEDVVVTAVEGVRESPAVVAALAGAAWSTVPWVHGASEQEQGRQQLVDAAQVWEAWLEAGRDAVNGRPGLAVGALLGGGALPRPRIKNGGDDGFLDGIEEGLLTVNDVGEAWDQAHAAKALRDRIVSLRNVPLPGIEALLDERFDLAHHEARGGHTILRHVDKRLETLQARLDLENTGPNASRSTFPDLATAQQLVRQALQDNERRLRQFARRPSRHTLSLKMPLGEPVGTVLHKNGAVTSGRVVTVILRKKAGQVYVHTAYLES